MPLTIKSSLQNGKYTIIKQLGKGGFSRTYLANQEMMNRYVCIKEFVIPENSEQDDEQTQLLESSYSSYDEVIKLKKAFLKEAQTIAQLHHPNIVNIHDIFEENGTAYYVMDYLSGGSLSDILHKDRTLPEESALKYIMQVADALRIVHQSHILHLDIKPENILLDKMGNAVLVDFGFAKQYQENGTEKYKTSCALSEGYAPIELYGRQGLSTFSPQTDIYSLGATFYKLLSGITPPSPILIMNTGLEPLDTSISPYIREAIDAAMQIPVVKRPENIEAFIALLQGQPTGLRQGQSQQDKNTETSALEEIDKLFEDGKYEELLPSLKKLASEGNSDAQCRLGNCYYKGFGVKIDYNQAYHWTRMSAEQGNSWGQYYLGVFYNCGCGVQPDDYTALQWYKKAAEQNLLDARIQVGYAYLVGEGTEIDTYEAVEWLEPAAKEGDSRAQEMLGRCYLNGWGVQKDNRLGMELLTQSANQGNYIAQYQLALVYQMGKAIRQNEQLAIHWLRKSAEQGYPEAQNAMGEYYLNRECNNEKALYWFGQAAEKGSAEAQYNISQCYEIGLGVEQSYEEADKWLEKAAAQGYEPAIERLNM